MAREQLRPTRRAVFEAYRYAHLQSTEDPNDVMIDVIRHILPSEDFAATYAADAD